MTEAGDSRKASPTPLHYGPSPRMSRRRVIALAVTLALGATGFAAYRWWPDVVARAELLYLQRRCMTYRAPPDLIIYTQDPDVGERLLASGLPYKGFTRRERTARRSATTKDGVEQSRPTDVWYVPRPWAQLPAGRWAPGPAFLHGRRALNGLERLIALEMSIVDDERVIFYCRTFTPASLTSAGNYLRTGVTIQGTYHLLTVHEHVQVYAGHPDPDDPAAFSFRCDVGARSGTIEGRLGDDGAVTLAAREPWLRAQFHAGVGLPAAWRGPNAPPTRPVLRPLGRRAGATTQP